MSLLKKVQQRSVERKFGGTHPILRMGLDRNVIDAYFMGLVFAAVADDESIDDAERQKLKKIGLAMNISDEDVAAMMSDMLNCDSDAKIAVAEECANALKGTSSIPMFVCEWSQIWMSHTYKQDELDDFRAQLCEWLGVECEKNFCSAFDAISTGAGIDEALLHRLTDKISEDDLLYLCFDKADEIKRILDAERVKKEHEEKARKEREAAKQRAIEAKHREEQEKIKEATAIRNSYNTLVSLADECIKLYGKKFTRAIYLDIKKMWDRYGYPHVNMQKLFHEIGQQFVSRIEALHISYSPDPFYLLLYKSNENSSNDQAMKISLQTVWMLIALCSQHIESERMSVNKAVELLTKASRLSGDLYRDHVSSLWHRGVYEMCCESVFCPLLGVDPVWKDLSFSITDEQRTKIREWKSVHKHYSMGKLKDYACNIVGASPYIDNDILMSI